MRKPQDTSHHHQAQEIPGLFLPALAKVQFSRFNAFPLNRLPTIEGGKEPSRELLENVKANGVIYPILVHDQSPLVIKDGRRRVKAAIAAGQKDVPLILIHGCASAGSALGLAAQEIRSDNPMAEVQLVQELVRAGATLEQVCGATGKNVQRLRKLMGLTALVEPLFQAAARGAISDTVALRVAKLGRDEQAKALALFDRDGELTGKVVSSLRRIEAQTEFSAIPTSALANAAPIDWETRVHALLSQAASISADTNLRRQILDLASFVGARTGTARAA